MFNTDLHSAFHEPPQKSIKKLQTHTALPNFYVQMYHLKQSFIKNKQVVEAFVLHMSSVSYNA